MLQITTDNSIILDFLSKYPESQRQSCAEAILIYGIRTIKSKFPYGLTAPQLLSVSGLNLEAAQKFSSANNSMSNKSIDVNRVVPASCRNDDVTERFRESRWGGLESKPLTNSEKKRANLSSPVREPNTANYERIRDMMKGETFERENEVMKIADNFLKSSYFSFLSN